MAPPPPHASPSLVQLLFIEPSAFVRVLDLDYQAERFAVFHVHALTRWTHYLGTPLMLAALFLLAWPFAVGPVPAPVLLGLALSAWYLRLDWTVGLAGTVALAGLALLAGGAHQALGWGPGPALAAVALLAGALNLSHAVEPVPPTLTGRGFEAFPVFWRRATADQRLRVLALNAAYLPLEVVSAPRLFPVHVLRALHTLGWRRAWSADVARRAEAVRAP
jgi:hypothetical protein